jgi:hypothetical protein
MKGTVFKLITNLQEESSTNEAKYLKEKRRRQLLSTRVFDLTYTNRLLKRKVQELEEKLDKSVSLG